MKERHKAVPASYLILLKDGKILLGRRYGTGYYDGWYALPSGHVEAGELPLDCMQREAMEEIGIRFDKRDAKLVHTMYRAKHDDTGERADYFFTLEKWQGDPKNMEPNKCDDLRWFSLNELPKKVVHSVGIALEHYKEGINYSEIPYNENHLNPNLTTNAS